VVACKIIKIAHKIVKFPHLILFPWLFMFTNKFYTGFLNFVITISIISFIFWIVKWMVLKENRWNSRTLNELLLKNCYNSPKTIIQKSNLLKISNKFSNVCNSRYYISNYALFHINFLYFAKFKLYIYNVLKIIKLIMSSTT
jgi:hypothetical protein